MPKFINLGKEAIGEIKYAPEILKLAFVEVRDKAIPMSKNARLQHAGKMIGEEQRTVNVNLSTELAKERTHAAYENNLLAWIRTSLSLIGFGIGIFEVAQKTNGETIFRSSKLIGLLLVLLGMGATLMAMRENKKNHERLLHPQIRYERKTSLGIKVSYFLVALSLLAALHIIAQIIQLGI